VHLVIVTLVHNGGCDQKRPVVILSAFCGVEDVSDVPGQLQQGSAWNFLVPRNFLVSAPTLHKNNQSDNASVSLT
jgi:hypothetical protein